MKQQQAKQSEQRKQAEQREAAAKPVSAQAGQVGGQDKVQGEGDYESARRYDADVREFVESGKVEQAAQQAAPKNAREQQEMQRAEEAGKAKAKR